MPTEAIDSSYHRLPSGRTLHVLSIAGDRPPLVLVPGWLMPAEVFSPVLSLLSRSFEPYALSCASHGRSEAAGGRHSIALFAEDLHDLLRAKVRSRSFYLLGWSIAVMTVLEYCRRFSEPRPLGLILVDGAPVGARDGERGMTTERFRELTRDFSGDREAATPPFIDRLTKEPLDPDHRRELIEAALRPTTDQALAILADMYSRDYRPILSSLDLPTLVLATEDSALGARQTASELARGRLQVIEQAGHALFLDQPSAFARALTEFAAAITCTRENESTDRESGHCSSAASATDEPRNCGESDRA